MYDDGDIASVLITEEQIREKTAELAEQVGKDYAEPLLRPRTTCCWSACSRAR